MAKRREPYDVELGVEAIALLDQQIARSYASRYRILNLHELAFASPADALITVLDCQKKENDKIMDEMLAESNRLPPVAQALGRYSVQNMALKAEDVRDYIFGDRFVEPFDVIINSVQTRRLRRPKIRTYHAFELRPEHMQMRLTTSR